MPAARRQGTPLALAIIDVDHFKIVNDTYGHTFGDHVLAALAGLMRVHARAGDVVSRHGGEEFTLLMPDTGGQDAVGVAERIRCAAAEQVISDGTCAARVSLSIGVAAIEAGGTGSAEDLLRRADEALYVVKQSGRNGARLWRPSSLTPKGANTSEIVIHESQVIDNK